MYHELQVPGRQLCQNEEGYIRYVVREEDLRRQVAWLRAEGFCGLSVSEALRRTNQAPSIAMTFDDGCETDLIVAAPLLKEAGFGATFYVVTTFLGRPGYLSPAQLRELCELGFEAGCHSMTHSYLTDLDPEKLRTEIAGAKGRLEQLLGRPVQHFSCPGGRWDRRVAMMAREAGYCSVATSRVGRNSSATDPFRLARLSVLRCTKMDQFARWCRAEGLFVLRAREAFLSAAKVVLGNSTYERLRSALFRQS